MDENLILENYNVIKLCGSTDDVIMVYLEEKLVIENLAIGIIIKKLFFWAVDGSQARLRAVWRLEKRCL